MSQAAYQKSEWDAYAVSHQSVMPSVMFELNQAVADRMSGDVLDCGCGTAKVAPFVLEQPSVSSYTGIDYAQQMVDRARWMIDRFPGKPSEIIYGKIEELEAERHVDSCLSINSYYAWDDPLAVLSHIYTLLREGGQVVLATPNNNLDMPKLLAIIDKEIIAHPCYPDFRQMNLAFCDNPDALFVDMDDLIKQVQSVGFHVIEAHQRFYLGGLNFLLMYK